MKQLLTVLSVLFSLTLSAQTVRVSYDESSQSIVFGNNRYKMIHVSGGSFTMGATPEQGFDAKDNEKPAQRVTLSDYHIGQTEVTQALWEAVMGNNPSYFVGPNRPVGKVSWNDCQDFIRRLNSMTGKNFCLPTEAQWEFAARGGNKSHRYKYSGSNSIGNIAVYKANAYDVGEDSPNYGVHDVATKQANELGIYDMAGNVWEWCSDWRGDYNSFEQTNPTGPYSGSRRVNRGGGWHEEDTWCRVSCRSSNPADYTYSGLGLRLALVPYSSKSMSVNYLEPSTRSQSQQPQTARVSYDTSSRSIVFGNNCYKMIYVSGGSFMMGATSEQGPTSIDEKPVHRVTLSGYYIGQTEVTQALWQAVMGDNPSRYWTGDNLPVQNVSWNDCQTFIRKLNTITGLRFRLPTEAEWEFAARGGNKSRRYKYSGSNNIAEVAWYGTTMGNANKTHPVAQKKANELGIYDMSGNVWEWCSDWHVLGYNSSGSYNPTGPNSGTFRVLRGGSWYYGNERCRVADRSKSAPSNKFHYVGLRLVLVP